VKENPTARLDNVPSQGERKKERKKGRKKENINKAWKIT